MMNFAFILDSAGIGEWIILLVVVLIVVGPRRLPEVARKLGRFTETLRRSANEFKRQIMTMDQPSPKPYAQEPAPLPHEAEGGGLGQAALPAERDPVVEEREAGRARSPSAPQQESALPADRQDPQSFSSDAEDDGPVNLFAPTAERKPESEAQS